VSCDPERRRRGGRGCTARRPVWGGVRGLGGPEGGGGGRRHGSPATQTLSSAVGEGGEGSGEVAGTAGGGGGTGLVGGDRMEMEREGGERGVKRV
jgi:hypothetical protein